MKKLSPFLQVALGLGACGLVWWLEHRRTLRSPETEPKERRVARNLAIAGATALVTQFAEQPVVRPLSEAVDRNRWGVLPRLGLPRWLEVPIAVVLMDYTLYLWHIMLHHVPLLWRCHVVHHIDLDMDASTALRFHFSEFLVSVPYRAAQVLLLGVRPPALKAWQALTAASVVFHHSNIRLPYEIEQWLVKLVVTPRLHGIHHSIVPEESNSNFSSGLTIWDFLHGTARMNVPQEKITIGVAAYRDPDEVRLPKMMALPFEEQPDSKRLPDGSIPQRPTSEVSPRRLLP